MTVETPGTQLTFRVVQPQEIAQVKQEVKAVFFSGEEEAIDAQLPGSCEWSEHNDLRL